MPKLRIDYFPKSSKVNIYKKIKPQTNAQIPLVPPRHKPKILALRLISFERDTSLSMEGAFIYFDLFNNKLK